MARFYSSIMARFYFSNMCLAGNGLVYSTKQLGSTLPTCVSPVSARFYSSSMASFYSNTCLVGNG